ncbi:WD40 repeat-like protein [Meredithblackwellia eburnea MCA 4105]
MVALLGDISAEVPLWKGRRLVGHREKIRSLAWSVDGRRLASGSTDKTIRVWQPDRIDRGDKGMEIKGHTGEVSTIRWDPTHPEHLVSCSAATGLNMDRGVYFWDIRQAKPTSVVQSEGQNINMCWSPDGKTVVVGNRLDVIIWIDVIANKVIHQVKDTREVNESRFSNNGSLLFTTFNGNIDITSHPSRELVHSVNSSPVSSTTLDLDPRGRYMAVGSNDANITLWETTDWTCVRSLPYHDEPIRSVQFSYDGQFLASASAEPEVHITAVPSGKKVHTFKCNSTCDSFAWHPSRMLLALSSEDPATAPSRSTGVVRLVGREFM